MTNNCIVYTTDDITRVVAVMQKYMPECRVFALSGPLGAGKTTLVREFAKACGVQDIISSPTFTYVNVYHTDTGQVLYHFDLYRIKTVEDFIAAGFHEYLYAPNSWALIEWPEVIMPLLTHAVWYATIDYHGEQERQICYSVR